MHPEQSTSSIDARPVVHAVVRRVAKTNSPRRSLTARSPSTTCSAWSSSLACCSPSSNRPPLSPPRNTPNNQFHLNSGRSRHASVRKPYPFDQPRDRQGPVVRLVRARPKPPPTLANPTLAVSVNAAEFVKVVVVPRSATL